MTPEQKIITIAEFEGWKEGVWSGDCHCGNGWLEPGETQESALSKGNCIAWRPRDLPPYLTYRDAICGAVARLDDVGRMKFVWHLSDIFCGYEPELVEEKDMPALEGSRLPLDYVANMILATPAQLADALLLTLGYEI